MIDHSPKPARVEHHSVEENVFSCFADLRDKGDEIQMEMVRMCSAFHKNVDNIGDLEDVLETTENCRNVLLKIVCAMSSRIDSFCPEFSTLETVISKLIDSDKDYQNLIQCIPVYFYNEIKYFLQEELMVIFRQTPYRNILTQSPSLTRVTKSKKDIENIVLNMDVLSDDILFLECSDVTRILQVPLFDKIKTPLLKKNCETNKASKPSTGKVYVKTENIIKSPNSFISRSDCKSKTPKSFDSKTQKSGMKKLQKNKAVHNAVIETDDSNPGTKIDKDLEQALSLIRIIKLKKDSEEKLLFKHFMEVPSSKSYHSVIKYPMSLEIIEQGILAKTIKTVSEVISRCLLIIQNARYYNEETSEIHECALNLQKVLLECMPKDSAEVIISSTRFMIDIAEKLKANTEINSLTKAEANSKFVNMSFHQFYLHVKSGYYTRFDRFQDDLLHIIISNMNLNQFSETETKLLSIMKYYLTERDRITAAIKSHCFELTMEKFTNHYKDRLDVVIPHSAMTCLTHEGFSYMVGDKVRVIFSENDKMILHINSVNSPCWIAGTVYFEMDDTLLKTDIKDIVHVKFITEKVTKRYRTLSFNYRTRLASDIVTNKSKYCRQSFPSLFNCLTLSRFNNQTVTHGTTENKTFYSQYVRENGDIFKVGDFVYLKSDKELPYIARIDKIHKDKKNLVWVHGPWFIRPMDTAFYESKSFYPNEVFMSNISDVNHINSIEGHCYLLSSKDFALKHPLSFLEKDTYICDNKYDESNHKFSKLSENKLYYNPVEQLDNLELKEWFYFSKPRSLFKTTKPAFQKPVQVDVDSSSDEETESDESDDMKESNSENSQPSEDVSTSIHNAAAFSQAKDLPKLKNTQHTGTIAQKVYHNKYTPQKVFTTISEQRTPTITTFSPAKTSLLTPKQVSQGVKTVQCYNVVSALNQETTPQRNDIAKVPPHGNTAPRTSLICRWSSCRQSFTDNNEYYKHVINTQTHLNGSKNANWKCYWNECTETVAKREGTQTQILLRRHVLSHMLDAGYSHINSAKNQSNYPKILRHSEAYKTFLNKLIVKKLPQQQLIGDTALED